MCSSFHSLLITDTAFVPSDFEPVNVAKRSANEEIIITCPFYKSGNPPANCSWSRTDINNVTHKLQITRRQKESVDFCVIRIFFTEDDNGLYQCIGHNEVGNTSYTFPEKFIVESK